MKPTPLLQTKGPWLHVLVANESEVCDRSWALQKSSGKVVARLIRGHKARNTPTLFDEVAAALQFPCYFGENWDAFAECLTDLEWLPGDAYILFITNSNRLLEEESPQELRKLLDLLAYAGEEWSRDLAGDQPRSAKPFHTVLQCTKEDEPRLGHKMQATQVAWGILK
jgi:RNAse (barnase) inhibitor barstar